MDKNRKSWGLYFLFGFWQEFALESKKKPRESSPFVGRVRTDLRWKKPMRSFTLDQVGIGSILT